MKTVLRIAAVLLLFVVAPSMAQGLAVNIGTPIAGARVGTPVRVSAAVSGPFEAKSVRAVIGDQALDLAFQAQNGWVGSFDLTPFARGPLTLTVTATDAVGATASATRSFTYDRFPVVTLTAPAGPAVATPHLVLKATCVDDDPAGCSRIEARVGPLSDNDILLASGRDSLDTVIDLSPYDGRELSVVVIAYDSAQQAASVSQKVFVEGSLHLRRVAEVPGEVIDADVTRVLYRHAASGALTIRQRDSGIDTTIYSGSFLPFLTRLTPAGAAFMAETTPASIGYGMFSWESGTLIQVGLARQNFEVEGPFILWAGGGRAYRRDVVAGVTTEVGTDVSDIHLGVAPDGAATWSDTSYNVVLARADGTVVPVAAAGSKFNVFPRTDGQSVVYRRQDQCCQTLNPSVMLYRNGVTTELAPGGGYHTINSGWVVYGKPGATNVQQVWRLGPTGEPAQLTFFSSGSDAHQVAPDGRVLFRNSGRFYVAYGDANVNVASSSLTSYESQGRFFLSKFGTVFEIVRAPLVASPPSVLFPAQPFATPSAPRQVAITNSSDSVRTGLALTVEGPFALSHDCGTTLGTGLSCMATVVFNATQVGPNAGNLRITFGGGDLVVPLSGTAERSLVSHYYRTILGREADSGGKVYWEQEAQRMVSLGADRSEAWYAMAMSFFFGWEYLARSTNPTQFTRDLYRTFFNRDADLPGLDYWTGQMAAGMPREVVLAGFMFSPEFAQFTRNIFGDTSARAEVNVTVDFYRGLLARLPDDAGFAHWVGRFRAAQCSGASAVVEQAEAISAGFVNSAEYTNRARTNAQFVGDLYNAVLRRGGDLAGVQFWIGQLNQGTGTRDSVRRAFVNSPEFSNRVQQVVQQGCLQ
jgi:hypothetical protein